MAKPAQHRCLWSPAKRGTFLVCSVCEDRFPCAGNDCGHMDCIETRGELPKCHYCSKRVEGPKGESWTPWLIHGHTRAAHYSCRDANSTPAELARRGAL